MSDPATVLELLLPTEDCAENPKYGIPIGSLLVKPSRKSDRTKTLRTSTSTAPLNNMTDLQRLPTLMKLDEKLPLRMINAFKIRFALVAQNCNLARATAALSVFRDSETDFRYSNESDVARLSSSLIIIALGCLPDSIRKQIREASAETIDGKVKVDHCIFKKEFNHPLILIEDKSMSVFDSKLSGLRDLDGKNNGKPYSTGQFNYEDGKAIVGKLSYQATEKKTRTCKWAIVFGGKQFIVYHILYVKASANAKETVTMTYSDAIDTSSIETPYLALLVYMIITSLIPHNVLAKELDMEPAEGEQILENERTPSSLETTLNSNLRRTSSPPANLAQTPKLRVAFTPVDQTFIPYMRASPSTSTLNASSSQDMSPTSASPSLILTSMGFGAIGLIYWAPESVVVKFTKSKKEHPYLLREAAIYERLSSTKASSCIPQYYGLFHYQGTYALVLSDVGNSIEDFADLSLSERIYLYNCLQTIHASGVFHGDFEERNVAKSCQGLIILDFSHGQLDHRCPEDQQCWELQYAKDKLQLEDA